MANPATVKPQLACVPASNGVFDVSMSKTAIRSIGTCNTSAAICVNTVRVLWPISVTPDAISTRPDAEI